MTKKMWNKVVEILIAIAVLIAGAVTIWQAFNLNMMCIGAVAVFVAAVVIMIITDEEDE